MLPGRARLALSSAGASAVDAWLAHVGAPHLPSGAGVDGYRDPSRGAYRLRVVHRSWHGSGHWGDHGDRRELYPLSRGDAGWHEPEEGQASPDVGPSYRGWGWGQDPGGDHHRRSQQDRGGVSGGDRGPP